MLLSTLKGASIQALDGDIGSVNDFYFDDERWTVRYAIVDTGTWLTGRRVVVSIMSLLMPDWEGKRLPVTLTREQVRRSPDMASHPEVSRTLEAELLSYYGFPYYWAGDALWGPVAMPSLAAEYAAGPLPMPPVDRAEEVHLHSSRDLMGYHLHARDGEIGHVDDLLIDPGTWEITSLLVDTSNWIGGRAVVITPSSIGRIDWAGRNVRVNLSRETIAGSPEYGSADEVRESHRTR
jgi:sporulation protein YlmC with PRC-barrel domain